GWGRTPARLGRGGGGGAAGEGQRATQQGPGVGAPGGLPRRSRSGIVGSGPEPERQMQNQPRFITGILPPPCQLHLTMDQLQELTAWWSSRLGLADWIIDLHLCRGFDLVAMRREPIEQLSWERGE